jgi:copper oxidase (laccase) domain-containing protein
VGDEVVEAFRTSGHVVDRWFTRTASGRAHVDLWAANADQLIAAGVRTENVHVARLCTKTHDGLFHSYRVEQEQSGRMAALIRSAR